MKLALALATLALSGAAAGCSGCSGSDDDAAARASAGETPLAAAAPVHDEAAEPALDVLASFDACELGHRGALLDLGDATMHARMPAGELTPSAKSPIEVLEREGATWAGVRSRRLELSFFSPVAEAPPEGMVVQMRVRGGAARRVLVYLNGKLLGRLRLAKDETKILSLHAEGASLARGDNTLLLRFARIPRAAKDELAEIDWIRVGPADGDEPYAAPTRDDALTTVTLGGIARRSVSLRAPGFIRCGGFLPKGAVLEGYVGALGGEADAEVRVLVDRAEPRVAGAFHLGGGAPAWQPVSLPLGDVGTLGAIELVAKKSDKGARVVFAEPRVVTPKRPLALAPPASRGVIIVVLGTVAPRELSIYGGGIATQALAKVASSGTVFEGHRAASTFANVAVASMLTGLLPRESGVAEADAAIGPTPMTIGRAARQGGVVTAMFTANPTTSAAFGFARGFETFTAHVPGDKTAATAVFDDAARWLDAHEDDRFLVVIHARGGHPPWDVTSEELKAMPPANYEGSLEPKHAGEALAKAHRAGKGRFFTDADRERAYALHAAALRAHDAALGRLLAHLHALGRDEDTTIIVTGDVGVDQESRVPFVEDGALDESALAIPLVVDAPGPAPRARVSAPTSGVDVARTALAALGLPPPSGLRGASLLDTARRGPLALDRAALAATASRLSLRWGGFVLEASRGREGKLCSLSLEPACLSDVKATHPLAAGIMHRLVFDEMTEREKAPPKVKAARPDGSTPAGLRAWGR